MSGTAARLLGPVKDLNALRNGSTPCTVSVDKHGFLVLLEDGRSARLAIPPIGLLGFAGEIVLLFGDLATVEVKSALLLLERLAFAQP